jgi:GNAT superfamily N-acetyltransferase
MKIHFRLGKKEDAQALSALALRSKAFWPYDEKFIQACAEDLTISETRAAGGFIVVAETENQILGFYGFDQDLRDAEMTHLFVEPSLIGKGLGFQLWSHAVQFAKDKGLEPFKLIADPYAAEKFYLKVGCEQVGEVESSVVPGRKLPLLVFR